MADVTGRNDDIIVRALQSPQSRICRQPASHWAGTGSAASQGAQGAVFLDEAANGWRALRSTDHGQRASARAPQGAQFAIGCPATGDNCYDRNSSVRICGTEIRRTKERSELLAEFNEWLRVNKMPPEPNDAEVPAKPWNILQYLGLL